jgi:integrase/recombinase XerD
VNDNQRARDTLSFLDEHITPGMPQLDEDIVDLLSRRNSKQGLAERTKRTYKEVIRSYNQFLADKGLDVGLRSVKLFFDEISDHLRPSSLNLYKSALLKCVKAQVGENDLFKCMAIEKGFEQIPTYKVDKSVPRGECLTEDEIQKMIGAAPEKARFVIHFLYKTACRVGEMIQVKLRDCQQTNGHIKIRVIGKAKKVRSVYIPTDLYDEIQQVYGGKKWLFESRGGRPLNRNNIGHQIKQAGERIGKSNVNPHMLRHVRATDMLLNKGISLKAVSKYLGHSSVAITAGMYIHDEVNASELFAQDKI